MAAATRLYTPAEAGAVTGVGLKSVHNAIDKHIVASVTKQARGKTLPPARMLTTENIVQLRLWHSFAGALPAGLRARLFEAMAEKPEARTFKADEFLIVDVAAARKQVAAAVRDLEAAEKAVVRDPKILGGEPVFKGTRVPVHAVAAMLAVGADEDELLAGYPALDRRKLELARLWAKAHPRRGRPKPLSAYGLSLKSSERVTAKADPLAGRTAATKAAR